MPAVPKPETRSARTPVDLQLPDPPAGWRSLLATHPGGHLTGEFLDRLGAEYVEHEVFPLAPEIFRAFELTAPGDVRAVILGQDPYHTPGKAHGLAFSVPPGTTFPPSLRNILREAEEDLGLSYLPASGCLEPWARSGVLLLNTVLTVRSGSAGSHAGMGWERFTDAVIECLARADRAPTAFLLWGNHAQKKRPLIDEDRHGVFAAPHPSPFSAHRGFFGSRPFSRTNHWLKTNEREPIDWSLQPPQPLDGGP